MEQTVVRQFGGRDGIHGSDADLLVNFYALSHAIHQTVYCLALKPIAVFDIAMSGLESTELH